MKKKYSDLIRNPFFDALCFYIVFAIFGLVYPSGWTVLFSVVASFVICDVILSLIIHGDKGWTKIFEENTFACKGHAFIALFIGIIGSSLASAFFAEWFLQWTQSQFVWTWTVLITDLIIVLAVLGDLLWRFY